MSADASFAVFTEGHATSLSPAEIERELTSMWKPINEAQGASVSRVVLGNVLWIGTSARVAHARQVFQRVIPKYPSRVFLMEYQEDNASSEISAVVNAQCFLPTPGAPPVCCEVIHLLFGPNSAKHLRGVVAPLLVPDVQTLLWTNLGSVPLAQLKDLQQHVDRTIRQASLAKDPAANLETCLGEEHPSFDLAWFRLRPIREQVATFFDDPDVDFRLDDVASVEVDATLAFNRAASSLPVLMCALHVGWFASRLHWEPKGPQGADFVFTSPRGPVAIRYVQAAQDESAHLSTLRMTDRSGRVLAIALGTSGMDISLSSSGNTECTHRVLTVSELPEHEALGVAINSPAIAWRFREAAAMAIPALRHFLSQERSHA